MNPLRLRTARCFTQRLVSNELFLFACAALVSVGALVCPALSQDLEELTSCEPVATTIPGGGAGTICVFGDTQYVLDVPAEAILVKIELVGSQDVDVYASFDREVLAVGTTHDHGLGPVDADFVSETPQSRELIEISPESFPPLEGGEYYIGISNCAAAEAEVTLTATWWVALPKFARDPSKLEFGEVPVGQSAELDFTITNTGEGTLMVKDSTSAKPDYTIVNPTVPFGVEAGVDQLVTVRFEPIETGSRNTTLRMTIDDPTRSSGSILVRGSGIEAPAADLFKRGDADSSGEVNITDAVSLLSSLFGGADAPSCPDAADTDDGGSLNITDAVLLLNFLFASGERPHEPFEECGSDPTDDELGCDSFPPCG